MSPSEVKILPHRWVEPDRQISGVEVARDPSGLALLRCPDQFYWLEVKNEHGHFVTARKDLNLTDAEFSETLSNMVAVYRRSVWEKDTFVKEYTIETEARKLLAAGRNDSLANAQRSFGKQILAVAGVGFFSFGLLAVTGDAPAAYVVGYCLAAAGAWAMKALQTNSEIAESGKILLAAGNAKTETVPSQN